MFHLAAYLSAGIIVTTENDIPALTDPALSIRNNHYVPPVDMQLLGVYAMGAQLAKMRMLTPKIQAITGNYIHPVDRANLPSRFGRGMDFRRRPFVLRGSEELQFKGTDATITSASQIALAFLGITPPQQTQGEVYNLRWTSTTAAVANVWTQLAITFENTLPAGVYAVVGGAYYATNAIAMRVIFPGQVWRPGVIGYVSEPGEVWAPFEDNTFDTFGLFNTVSLPNLEVLNGSTDAVHSGYLDIIKTS
jgi:hypothetical protein